MAPRHALELMPHLTVLDSPSDDLLAREFEHVAQAVEEHITHITVVRPGLLLAPAAGPARYHGGETQLVTTLSEGVTDATGVALYVGIANGTLPAILAARTHTTLTAEQTTPFLRAQPLTTVRYALNDPSHTSALNNLLTMWSTLGIHTYADLAALRHSDVRTRFGVLGAWVHHLATGRDDIPPPTVRTEPDITITHTPEHPIERIDTAAFHAKILAEQLHTELTHRGAAAHHLTITAHTDNGTHTRTWRADTALLGAMPARAITQRVRWQLEGWLTHSALNPHHNTPAPLVRLDLAATDLIPATTHQEDLWGGQHNTQQALHHLVQRLSALIGPDNVLAVDITGGRTPTDRIRHIPWDQRPSHSTQHHKKNASSHQQVATTQEHHPWPGQLPTPSPATLFPPTPTTLSDPAGLPVALSARGTLESPPYMWTPTRLPALTSLIGGADVDALNTATHTVTNWAGPWTITTSWWTRPAPTDSTLTYLQLMFDTHPPVLLVHRADAWHWEGTYD